jgi:hypothetical protein
VSDLVAFLRARLDEDEATARAVPADVTWDVYVMSFEDRAYDYPGKGESLDHAARWSPARVLAEVAARRRIIAAFEAREEQGLMPGGEVVGYHATGLLLALRALAETYVDHPDFNPEWRLA